MDAKYGNVYTFLLLECSCYNVPDIFQVAVFFKTLISYFPVKRAEGLEADIAPEVEKKSQEGFVAEEVKEAKPDSKASVKTQVKRLKGKQG